MCPTLCDTMDCSPLGSSVHGIPQVRELEWVAIPFSRGSSWLRDQTKTPWIIGSLYCLSYQGSPRQKLIRIKLKKQMCMLRRFSWVQSLSHVWLFATPWTEARQASLSITNSRSSLRLTSIESVMPSSHLILCRPLLLLPPIPSSIRVFSNESTFRMRWPKYWSLSFSISPSNEASVASVMSNSLQPHGKPPCGPPGSSVYGILQAKILEWVAIFSSRGSSQPREWTGITCISCIGGRFFTWWAIRGTLDDKM